MKCKMTASISSPVRRVKTGGRDESFMTIENRLTRVETEVRFRHWLRIERIMEAMSVDELKQFAATGQWPDRPEPAPGASTLDTMDRSELIKLWQEDLRDFAGRNSEELEFFAVHGYWPEQHCREECSPP